MTNIENIGNLSSTLFFSKWPAGPVKHLFQNLITSKLIKHTQKEGNMNDIACSYIRIDPSEQIVYHSTSMLTSECYMI